MPAEGNYRDGGEIEINEGGNVGQVSNIPSLT